MKGNASEPGLAGSGSRYLEPPDNLGRALGPQSSPPPPLQVPDHELLHPIGTGSYGDVWLARSKLGTLRAVKIVYRTTFEDSRPFEREFKGIKNFEPISRTHDGLVDILQVGGTDEFFYYVMELADGVEVAGEKVGKWESEKDATARIVTPSQIDPQTYSPKTLRSVLFPPAHFPTFSPAQPTRLPLTRCIEIGLALADALAHLHKNRLVHRDIKPSNIIFVEGRPKLADIGLVADVSEARSYVGTDGFIPPEGPGTAQADLYSLGKVLYEISTGQDRRDFPALPADLAEQEAMLELNALLLKACKTDVKQRYASAAEMRADLELLQRGASLKRRRAMSRCFAVAKKLSLGAAALLLIAGGIWLVAERFHPSSVQLSNAPVELNSIAVLPFDNDSPDKADDYLGTAMAEELSGALTKIPELRVLGRDTSASLKFAKDRHQSARQLNLNAVLDGRVRKVGDGLHLSVQLLDPHNDRQLWSEVYARDLPEIFGIQTDITEKTLQALHVQLTESSRERLALRSTRNLEAYQLCLEGRFWASEMSGNALQKAIPLFERAVVLDTNFALAYAGLAHCYVMLNDYTGIWARECLPRARTAAEKALQLDERVADAHTALASVVAQMDWDWPRAEREYKRAIALNPNSASIHSAYAWFLLPLRRFDEALAKARRARDLDPLSPGRSANFGSVFYWTGRYDDAIEQFLKTISIDPSLPQPHYELGRAYERKGRFREAVAETLKAKATWGWSQEELAALQQAYDGSGIKGFWEKELELDMKRPTPRYDSVAQMCARIGRNEQAFEWLEKAMEDRCWLVAFIHLDPCYEGLRSDSRFIASLKKMGLEK